MRSRGSRLSAPGRFCWRWPRSWPSSSGSGASSEEPEPAVAPTIPQATAPAPPPLPQRAPPPKGAMPPPPPGMSPPQADTAPSAVERLRQDLEPRQDLELRSDSSESQKDVEPRHNLELRQGLDLKKISNRRSRSPFVRRAIRPGRTRPSRPSRPSTPVTPRQLGPQARCSLRWHPRRTPEPRLPKRATPKLTPSILPKRRPPAAPTAASAADRTLVATYNSGGNTYYMFSDGTIETETPDRPIPLQFHGRASCFRRKRHRRRIACPACVGEPALESAPQHSPDLPAGCARGLNSHPGYNCFQSAGHTTIGF